MAKSKPATEERASALRESRRFLQGVLDAMPALVAVLDENGVIAMVNRAWTEAAAKGGLDPQAVGAGTDYLAMCEPKIDESSEGAREAADGIRQVLRRRRGLFRVEYPCHTPQRKRWFEMRVSPLSFGGRDWAILTHIDITDRKQVEEGIRSILAVIAPATGEEFFRLLVKQLAAVLGVRCGLLGELVGSESIRTLAVWAGEDFTENFSYPLAGTPCGEVLREGRRDWLAGVREQYPADNVLSRLGAEGCLAVRLEGAGARPLGVLAVMDDKPLRDTPLARDLLEVFASRAAAELQRRRDEEERRELEARVQHAQKLESLGVLAGGIAHDFNNLLVGILGNADLAMLETDADSPVRESLEAIKAAGIRAADLTNQMLAYSGRGRFLIEPTDLNRLVERMGELLHASIPKKVRLELDLAKGLPAIEADPAQLRQVAMNLITNAAEAIGDDEGAVTVRTGRTYLHPGRIDGAHPTEELPGGDYVFLEVADTGCGMDDDARHRMFEPFFSTKFAGRGLGLAAVEGIVRGHSGAITVDSRVGKGTTVRVILPCPRKPPVVKREPEGPEPVEAWRATGTVLVADDQPEVLATAERILQHAGLTVLSASDGREGVRLFEQRADEISLVLLDATMPGLSGEEAVDEIAHIRPDVPVLICSGYAAEDVTRRFAGKPVAGFLSKPFEMAQLIREVRKAMEKA